MHIHACAHVNRVDKKFEGILTLIVLVSFFFFLPCYLSIKKLNGLVEVIEKAYPGMSCNSYTCSNHLV